MNDNSLNRMYAMTQQEAAEILGMSRPNLGAVEIRALAKLRIELEKRGYKMEDFIGGMQ